MRQLLINADDLGYDSDTFEVTTVLMASGAIRSATILLNYPQSDAAIRFARENQREMSFGLHFNIAEGRPLAGPRVPSLVGPDGMFRGPVAQRLRALTGRLRADDIAVEATAQLEMLADAGVRPSHLDSHGHLHKFPPVLRALRPVLDRFGISKVRLPQTAYDNQRLYNRQLDRHCLRAFRAVGYASTDSFFNTRTQHEDWFDRFVASLGFGATELGVHPGAKEQWRAAEAAPLANDVAARLRRQGISLISYHDVAP